MPNRPKIVRVVEDDMCIACGACIYACPEAVVAPSYSESRGAYEVEVRSFDNCIGCPAPCEEVCPSLEVEFRALTKPPGDGDVPMDRHGPLIDVRLGEAPEYQMNGVSSSGGVVRAFVADALRRHVPVVCLGWSGESYVARAFHDIDELNEIPGSIYHGISFDGALAHLRDLVNPCLLVATPCQLEGIKKYIAAIEPELEAKILLTVGLICGWMYSDHSTRAMVSYKRIPGQVLDVQYRGEDEAGLLKIKSTAGTYKFNRRVFGSFKDLLDYRASYSLPLNRLRCRVCENHVNVLADIAIGDAWVQRMAGKKKSIVVTRTQEGLREMNRLCESGQLLMETGSVTDIDESQSRNLVYGDSASRLNAFLSTEGYITPKFEYGDDRRADSTRFQRALFRMEMYMRSVVRSSRYGRYRTLYLLRNAYKLVKTHLRIRRFLSMFSRSRR